MEEVRIERVSKRKESVEHHHRLYGILKSVLPEYVGRLNLLETAKKDNLHPYAVFLGDAVVGGYVLQDEGDIAYLEFIGLTEGTRQKGLGKLMVQHIQEMVKSLGKDRIRAETHHSNVPKFRRLGFREYFPGGKGMVGIYLDP